MVILAVTSGHTVLLVQLMSVPVHPGLAPALVPTILPRCCLLETTISYCAGGNCFVTSTFFPIMILSGMVNSACDNEGTCCTNTDNTVLP